jgi:hypothetical protein
MGSNNRSSDTKTIGFEMRFENNYGMYSHVFRLDMYLLIRSDSLFTLPMTELQSSLRHFTLPMTELQ